MFHDGEIICFLGDSITANGLWLAEFYQTVRKTNRIKCYNCGISGGTAENSLIYLYSRCLNFNPDTVVLMLGINDIKRTLYSDNCLNDKSYDGERAEALEKHKAAYEELVTRITDFGARVILCTPVPYDEWSSSEAELFRCQSAMDGLAEFVRGLADKYGCALVDLSRELKPMLKERQIISADRVHPTPDGYHCIAQIFLASLGQIEKPDLDTPFVMEEWNKKRHAAEMEIHKVNFVKYCALLRPKFIEGKSHSELLDIARERYEGFEDKSTFISCAYLDYINKIEKYEEYMQEIVKLTIF